MTTRAEFLARVRARLNDPQSKRWTDAEIEGYLDVSVVEYSIAFPRVREVEFTPDGVSNRFDVPLDLVNQDISKVWLILTDNTIYEIDGGITSLRRPERSYEVVGQELVLTFIPQTDQQIRLRYSALYEIPQSGHSLIPGEHEELIYLWALKMAWEKIAAADASLSRWKEEGKRDDSPIIPQYVQYEREWRWRVQRMMGRGSFTRLKRGKRYGRNYFQGKF